MIRSTPAPLGQQLLVFILGPPIMAWLWRLMSRGWALTAQGGDVSAETVRRQKMEFWILLALMYLISIVAALHEWLRRS